MSVIYGIQLVDRPSAEPGEMSCLGDATARYGPDGTFTRCAPHVAMGFQAFYTHGRSHLETLPSTDDQQNISVIDGRLDNYRELADLVGVSHDSCSDSALVLKLYARYGAECFARFVGDWAVALWSATDRTIYLARDHAGTRTLYYRNHAHKLTWSTYLEALTEPTRVLDLDSDFITRYLSIQQLSDLTPYKDIGTVPPAHVLVVRDGQAKLQQHWHSLTNKPIRYKTDHEYDEQFRYLFSQAVERRVPDGESIIAELSGGLDSSSIVCMSDHSRASRSVASSPVDTVSYFDETEPDWNERPYFGLVEAYRHKQGIHIDLSGRISKYEPLQLQDRIYPYVGGNSFWYCRSALLDEFVGRKGYRTIISGYGGDELLGGIPTPLPELADHLRSGSLITLLRRNAAWCIPTGNPFLLLLLTTIRYTLDLYKRGEIGSMSKADRLAAQPPQPCWGFGACSRYRRNLIHLMPSAIANGRAWRALLETLPHLTPPLLLCYEYRYPYLDRDLVEFLHSVPREQLVQPGRRRNLMRRALQNIVPIEVLERKRKARITQAPILDLRDAERHIEQLFEEAIAVDLGFVDRQTFLAALQSALRGVPGQLAYVVRTITLELWLINLATHFCLRSNGKQAPHRRTESRSTVAEI